MIGKVIGNYEVSSELAQGGMGAVYRGRHQKLPREVVVKSILLASFPPHAQDQLKARFVREAYIQSQLDHPNIVRVYEFFTSPENYYLVMEFVNGMSLRDLIQRQGALAPHQALPMFKQALAALDYAHNFSYVDESGREHKGIIHRDIKPANLLLDGKANLKITDFGIVKLAGERTMTRTGFNPGTVEYMSPEQIRGLDVDARSDLYSLGVAFYEALTGRLPFPFSETGSEYEVFRGHIEMPPPPIATVQSNVPPALAAIVMHSLEKVPDHRFSSAAEFLDALLEYEKHTASASLPTEHFAAARQPDATHSMTERLSYETNLAPLTAESTPAEPTSSNDTRQTAKPAQPNRATPPVARLQEVPGPAQMAPKSPSLGQSPLTGQPPRASQSRHTGLVLVAVVTLLLVGAAAAYFIWSRQSTHASPTDTPISSATPAVAPSENPQLQQARAMEQDERYVEAIKLLDEYLKNNPPAADAATVSARVAALRKVQGLLAVAELGMNQKDYAAAERDFSEALKLRPESRRAQVGLAEAKARLSNPR
jgi:serine/threonine-protein kinase